MQYRYEILILTTPDASQDDIKQMESLLSEAINKARGSVISFERWGKYDLAYPVKNHEYGVYYLMRYQMPTATDVNNELKALFAIRLGAVVMRFMISALEAGKSLEYQRPRSLEEAPPARESNSGYQRERRSFNDRNDMSAAPMDSSDDLGL